MIFYKVEAYTASWIEIIALFLASCSSFVEAYTASWIEIMKEVIQRYGLPGRSLYGFVD